MLQIQGMKILSANPTLNRGTWFQVSGVHIKEGSNLFVGTLNSCLKHQLESERPWS